MMGIGEAFAALGYNTWISTFCPFYDWKVLRRIAVGQQERHEAMAADNGWLSEGHGLDLTMLATAANFETRTNGATHMGNDDNLTFDAVAHLKIIDVSCPQQMLVADEMGDGGQSRAALRARHAHAVGCSLRPRLPVRVRQGRRSFTERPTDAAFIVSSGRGVHEAIAAARVCAASEPAVGGGRHAVDR